MPEYDVFGAGDTTMYRNNKLSPRSSSPRASSPFSRISNSSSGSPRASASLSPQGQAFRELEEKTRDLEREGNYSQAQAALNKLKHLNLQEGRDIQKILSKQHQLEKQELMQRQKLELETFSKVWDEKLREYEHQAQEILEATKGRHEIEYRNQEEALKRQLLAKKPKFSRNVLRLRSVLEKLVKMKQYAEAEDTRRQLREQEIIEIRQFEDELSATFDKKMSLYSQQQKQELNALKQRIASGRDELITQRKLDLDRLMQHHHNKLQELDVNQKRDFSKTSSYISRHSSVILTSPHKAVVDYSALSGTTSTSPRSSSSRPGSRSTSPLPVSSGRNSPRRSSSSPGGLLTPPLSARSTTSQSQPQRYPFSHRSMSDSNITTGGTTRSPPSTN